VLLALALDPNEYRLGTTKVFFKAGVLGRLLNMKMRYKFFICNKNSFNELLLCNVLRESNVPISIKSTILFFSTCVCMNKMYFLCG